MTQKLHDLQTSRQIRCRSSGETHPPPACPFVRAVSNGPEGLLCLSMYFPSCSCLRGTLLSTRSPHVSRLFSNWLAFTHGLYTTSAEPFRGWCMISQIYPSRAPLPLCPSPGRGTVRTIEPLGTISQSRFRQALLQATCMYGKEPAVSNLHFVDRHQPSPCARNPSHLPLLLRYQRDRPADAMGSKSHIESLRLERSIKPPPLPRQPVAEVEQPHVPNQTLRPSAHGLRQCRADTSLSPPSHSRMIVQRQHLGAVTALAPNKAIPGN